MPSMQIEAHVHIHGADDQSHETLKLIYRRLDELATFLNHIQTKVDKMAIDTSKALAAIQQQNTDNGSLRTLAAQIFQLLQTVSQQLADAIASNDPAALAQVQADLDSITALSNTDDQATKDAIAANTPAASGGGTPSAGGQTSAAKPMSGTGR